MILAYERIPVILLVSRERIIYGWTHIYKAVNNTDKINSTTIISTRVNPDLLFNIINNSLSEK
jgi:hypothetical protein